MRLLRCATSAAVLLGLCGCGLFGKSDPLMPRYFSPDAASAEASVAPVPLAGSAPIELRLGRVTAAAYLGERIVFRDSNYELNFYEERRWTERPEAYLRRALSRSLFEQHGARRIVSGAGPTLEVELTEFAELRLTAPVARVRLTYILYENRLVQKEATVTVELPIRGSPADLASPEPAVRVMTQALGNAVQRVVEQVLGELATRAPAQGAGEAPFPVPPTALPPSAVSE